MASRTKVNTRQRWPASVTASNRERFSPEREGLLGGPRARRTMAAMHKRAPSILAASLAATALAVAPGAVQNVPQDGVATGLGGTARDDGGSALFGALLLAGGIVAVVRLRSS
jgi:hypothetical protein